MKKIIAFFCLLHTTAAFSQSIQEDITKIDTVERNLFKKAQVKSVTVNSYDVVNGQAKGAGTKTEVRMYDPNGNKIYYWEPSEFEYTFKYDANGNRTEAINKDKYSNYTVHENWKFDTKNNCIQYLQEIDGKNQFNTQFKYDNNNHLIQETILFNSSSLTTYYYSYDSKGNETEKYTMQNGSKMLNEKQSYDAMGNMTEQINYFNNTINWRRVYKYDTNNRLIEDTWYDASGNISEAGSKTYSYKTSGKLLEQKYYDQAGKLFRTDTYSYDTNGKLLALNSNITGNLTYKYNDEGLLTEKKNGSSQLIKYTYEVY